MRRAETECSCPAIEDRRLHGIPDLDPGLRIGAVLVPSTTLKTRHFTAPAMARLASDELSRHQLGTKERMHC